jgi:Tfp pilus assembly protein PilF
MTPSSPPLFRFPRPRPLVLATGLTLLAVFVGGAYLGGRHLWAWRHSAAAEAALARRDFSAAREHLARCLEVWPNSPRTHLLAARAARQAGALEEAEQHLAACQRLLGDATEETTLEWALLQARRGDLPEVEKYLLAQLEEDHPDAIQILDVLTAELMRTRRLPEARHYLDQWLERTPDDADVLVRRGWVAERLTDATGAIADYQRALSVDPDRDRVRLRAAELLVENGRAHEALADFEELAARQAGGLAVRLGLARCRHRLGQIDEARRLLDALLAEHPEDPQVLGELGKVALKQGRPAEAEGWLKKAAARAPYDRDINYNLYQCLHQLGKGKEAEARACDARLKQLDDDTRRMGKLMQEAMRRPTDPAPRHEAGVIFLRNGLVEDGLLWLGMALEVDPRHRPSHLALAEYYERAGEPERAEPHRRMIRHIDQSSSEPRIEDRGSRIEKSPRDPRSSILDLPR